VGLRILENFHHKICKILKYFAWFSIKKNFEWYNNNEYYCSCWCFSSFKFQWVWKVELFQSFYAMKVVLEFEIFGCHIDTKIFSKCTNN
jgi:hypothetical protein